MLSLCMMNNAIFTFPSSPSLQNALYVTAFKITTSKNDENESLSLSFNVFSNYCQITNTYSITYKRAPCLDDLFSLLYLIKHFNPELYNKKSLILESIYKPYLYRPLFISSFDKKTDDEMLKGGVYTIDEIHFKDKDSYVTGGWVFAIYHKKDYTYKNVISNSWDECVTALCVIGGFEEGEEARIIAGYKSGNVKIWKAMSFHIVQFVDCVFKEFNEVKKILKIDNIRYAIYDNTKIVIWEKWKEEKMEFDIKKESNDEDNEIVTCCNYNNEYGKSDFVSADKKGNLFFIKWEVNKTYNVNKMNTDTNGQISSLKYFKERKILFAGNNKLVQVWNMTNENKIYLESVHFLNDEINYLEYHIYNNVVYLFCGGKKNIHLIHFSMKA